MRVVRLTLPLYCQPPLNEWRRWDWAKRVTLRKVVAQEMAVAVQTAFGHSRIEPMQKALVTATYHFPNKSHRNLANYSLKFVADALVLHGVLVSDDFKHCEEVVRMGDVETPGRIEIEVEEVGS